MDASVTAMMCCGNVEIRIAIVGNGVGGVGGDGVRETRDETSYALLCEHADDFGANKKKITKNHSLSKQRETKDSTKKNQLPIFHPRSHTAETNI